MYVSIECQNMYIFISGALESQIRLIPSLNNFLFSVLRTQRALEQDARYEFSNSLY